MMVKRVTMGMLALAAAVAVGCAGSNQQVSDESADSAAEQAEIPDHEQIVQIGVGSDHGCARAASGHVYCWGSNQFGQLGDGTTGEHKGPVLVKGIDDAVDLAVGTAHNCVVHEDTTVSCWGVNGRGALGLGYTSDRQPSPQKVVGVGSARNMRRKITRRRKKRNGDMCPGELSGARQVVAGVSHTCVLHETGAVLCFGDNDNNAAIATMQETDNVECPMPVWSVENATKLTAGLRSTCAILENGKLRCWGGDFFSVVDDIAGDKVDAPYGKIIDLRELEDVVAADVGGDHVCAVTKDGELKCAGSNSKQSLRPGGYTVISNPMRIEELSDVVGVATASSSQCAVVEDGSVHCWGRDKGEFQPGGSGPLATATRKEGLSGIVQVDVGGYLGRSTNGFGGGADGGFACALDRAGEVFCWGVNVGRRLGDDGGDRTEPRAIDFSEAFALAARAGEGEGGKDGKEGEGRTSCPKQRSWGDPAAPNSLTVRMGDSTRTLYLDEATVELDREENKLLVRLAPVEFGYADGYGHARHVNPQFTIELPEHGDPTKVTEPLRIRSERRAFDEQWDCMKFIRRNFGTVQLTRFEAPEGGVGDGLVEGRFQMYAGSPVFGEISGVFRARDFVSSDNFATVQGGNAFLKGDKMVAAERVEVVYRPKSSSLSVGLQPPETKKQKSKRRRWRRRRDTRRFHLSEFAGVAGTYRDGDRVFVIEEFAAGVARGKIYEMRRPKSAMKKPGRTPDEAVASQVTFGAGDTSDEKEEQTEKREIPKLFAMARYEAKLPDKERVLVAEFSTKAAVTETSMSKFEVELEREVELEDDSERDESYDKTFEPGEVRPLEFAKQPEPAHVVFERVRSSRRDKPHGWVSSFRRMLGWQIRPSQRKGGEALQFRMFGGGEELAVELRPDSLLPRQRAWQIGARYNIDQLKKSFPELARFSKDGERYYFPSIEATAEFSGGEVVLTAKNDVQGADTFTMEVPEDTIFGFQLVSLIEHLPLAPGYRTKLHTFQLQRRSRDGFASLEPKLHEAEISVVGEDSLQVDGADQKVWVVEVDGDDDLTVFVDKETGVVRFGEGWRKYGRILRSKP